MRKGIIVLIVIMIMLSAGVYGECIWKEVSRTAKCGELKWEIKSNCVEGTEIKDTKTDTPDLTVDEALKECKDSIFSGDYQGAFAKNPTLFNQILEKAAGEIDYFDKLKVFFSQPNRLSSFLGPYKDVTNHLKAFNLFVQKNYHLSRKFDMNTVGGTNLQFKEGILTNPLGTSGSSVKLDLNKIKDGGTGLEDVVITPIGEEPGGFNIDERLVQDLPGDLTKYDSTTGKFTIDTFGDVTAAEGMVLAKDDKRNLLVKDPETGKVLYKVPKGEGENVIILEKVDNGVKLSSNTDSQLRLSLGDDTQAVIFLGGSITTGVSYLTLDKGAIYTGKEPDQLGKIKKGESIAELELDNLLLYSDGEVRVGFVDDATGKYQGRIVDSVDGQAGFYFGNLEGTVELLGVSKGKKTYQAFQMSENGAVYFGNIPADVTKENEDPIVLVTDAAVTINQKNWGEGSTARVWVTQREGNAQETWMALKEDKKDKMKLVTKGNTKPLEAGLMPVIGELTTEDLVKISGASASLTEGGEVKEISISRQFLEDEIKALVDRGIFEGYTLKDGKIMMGTTVVEPQDLKRMVGLGLAKTSAETMESRIAGGGTADITKTGYGMLEQWLDLSNQGKYKEAEELRLEMEKIGLGVEGTITAKAGAWVRSGDGKSGTTIGSETRYTIDSTQPVVWEKGSNGGYEPYVHANGADGKDYLVPAEIQTEGKTRPRWTATTTDIKIPEPPKSEATEQKDEQTERVSTASQPPSGIPEDATRIAKTDLPENWKESEIWEDKDGYVYWRPQDKTKPTEKITKKELEEDPTKWDQDWTPMKGTSTTSEGSGTDGGASQEKEQPTGTAFYQYLTTRVDTSVQAGHIYDFITDMQNPELSNHQILTTHSQYELKSTSMGWVVEPNRWFATAFHDTQPAISVHCDGKDIIIQRAGPNDFKDKYGQYDSLQAAIDDIEQHNKGRMEYYHHNNQEVSTSISGVEVNQKVAEHVNNPQSKGYNPNN